MEHLLEDNAVVTDDDTLQLTQRVRRKLLRQMVSEGKLPEEPKSQQVLLAALKDMDKQVVDKKRLTIESKNTDNAAQIARMAEAITDKLGGSDIFKRAGTGNVPSTQEALLPKYEPVPGEMETNMSGENYNSFVEKFEKENPKPT